MGFVWRGIDDAFHVIFFGFVDHEAVFSGPIVQRSRMSFGEALEGDIVEQRSTDELVRYPQHRRNWKYTIDESDNNTKILQACFGGAEYFFSPVEVVQHRQMVIPLGERYIIHEEQIRTTATRLVYSATEFYTTQIYHFTKIPIDTHNRRWLWSFSTQLAELRC